MLHFLGLCIGLPSLRHSLAPTLCVFSAARVLSSQDHTAVLAGRCFWLTALAAGMGLWLPLICFGAGGDPTPSV